MTPADGVTVIVAEDEAVIRLDLVEQLTELGYSVVGECGDGATAVQLCRELVPQIALLDISMPVMDGLEAAGHIAGLGDTAVVMLTAYGQRELLERAISAGAMGYLTKPWSPGDLVAALELARVRFVEMRQLSDRADELADSLRKRKLIDRAKARLISTRQLNEPEAFRLLQKRAMDARTSMAEIAERILSEPATGSEPAEDPGPAQSV